MLAKQAVVLVGGRGSRLGALTDDLPKPILKVAEKPFLDYLLERLAKHGFTRVLLLTGYKGTVIEDHYRSTHINGIESITCVIEEEIAGTAGALMLASDYLDEEFLLLNGDSWFECDYRQLYQTTNSKNWLGSIALRHVSGDRYSRVALSQNNRVERFYKSGLSSDPNPINGGVYFLKKEVIHYIERLPCSLEEEVFPQLAKAGLLYGLTCDGYFIDIGIPSDFSRAQIELPSRVAG